MKPYPRTTEGVLQAWRAGALAHATRSATLRCSADGMLYSHGLLIARRFPGATWLLEWNASADPRVTRHMKDAWRAARQHGRDVLFVPASEMLANAETGAHAAVRHYFNMWSAACTHVESGGHEADTWPRQLATDRLLAWRFFAALPCTPETIVARDATCDRIVRQ